MSRRKNGEDKLKVTPRTLMEPFLYSLPFMTICLVFTIYPVINVFMMSVMENYNFLQQTYTSIGVDNFRYILEDKYFHNAMQNTLIYVFTVVPIATAIALLIAVMLNSKLKGISVYQTIFFLPMVTSSIAIGFVWRYMFNADYGVVNSILNLFGIASKPWLTHPHMAIWALVIFGIWNSLPFSIIMFLAGLQNIDEKYYIAARLDGAKPFRILTRITIPLLSPTIALVLIVRVISASKVFNEVYALWNGQPGPAGSLHTMVYYIFQQFYNKWEVGYASAAAVVLFLVVFVLTLIQLFVQKKFSYDK